MRISIAKTGLTLAVILIAVLIIRSTLVSPTVSFYRDVDPISDQQTCRWSIFADHNYEEFNRSNSYLTIEYKGYVGRPDKNYYYVSYADYRINETNKADGYNNLVYRFDSEEPVGTRWNRKEFTFHAPDNDLAVFMEKLQTAKKLVIRVDGITSTFEINAKKVIDLNEMNEKCLQ